MKEWIERHPWRLLAVVIAVLLLAFAFGYFESANGEPAPRTSECVDETTREKVRALMLDALDEALKEHVKRLYEVLMKDATDRTQPARAANGTRQGIRAYLQGRSGALNWNPRSC